MDGLIRVRKPLHVTSHDVVERLRRILGEKKVGHFGTLDPLASGLLLAGLGKATRLFPFFGGMDKTYQARVRLGFSTDTYDAAGRPTSEIAPDLPAREAVEAALEEFRGNIVQIAPPFSAKKHRGTPLYVYARKNEPVAGRASRVSIRSISVTNFSPPLLDFEVACSSGTYIRALADDLGRRLGCGAHLDGLIRTRIGEFTLAGAFSPEDVQALFDAGRIDDFLEPMEALLPHFPRFDLDAEGLRLVRNGRSVPFGMIFQNGSGPDRRPGSGELPVVRLFSPSGGLAALAKPSHDLSVVSPFIVFL